MLLCCCSSGAWAQLTANFSATTTTGCAPSVIQFNDMSTGGATSWSWDFGNSGTSTLQNPSTSYLTPGTYTVKLTVSNGSSTNTKTITNYIVIQPSPTISFTASDTADCPTLHTTFTNTTVLNAPGAGTYIWNFGTGAGSTVVNPSYNYPSPGYYTVTLTATNSVGCVTTKAVPLIHVYTPPTGVLNAQPAQICTPGTPTTISAILTGTPPYTYDWDFGDNSTHSTQASPSHTYSVSNGYNVTLIVTDGHGCKDTITQANLVVVGAINASFVATPTAICEDKVVNFSGTVSPAGTPVLWDFGDGTIGTVLSLGHIYTNPGTYTVKMIAGTPPCTDTVAQTVTIYPKPIINFTVSPLQPCEAPVSVQFTNTTTGGNGTYTWKFGDSTTGTGTNPLHNYTLNGMMTVTLYATSPNGCQDSLKRVAAVPIYPLGPEIFAKFPGGCAPLVDSFGGNAYTSIPITGTYPYGITNWHWDFGDGGTSNAQHMNHTFNNPGDYQVLLTITTANGCTDTVSKVIHVGTPPVANFGANPLVVCLNSPVFFTDSTTGTVTEWHWYFGDGGSSTAQNPIHTFSLPGTWDVTEVVSNNGCRDTLLKPLLITVNPPKSVFTPHYSCDTITKVQFENQSIGYTSCKWYFGDGTTSTQVSPGHIYADTGTYIASLVTYNSVTGCMDSTIVAVQIIKLYPTLVANDSTVCKGNTVQFTAGTSGNTSVSLYGWGMDGQLYPDTTAVINYTFANTGYYTITVYEKDGHGCVAQATKTNYVLVSRPVVQFTGTPLAGCAPDTVTFSNQTTFTPGTTYGTAAWAFGDGGTSALTTPTVTHVYNSAGSFFTQLIVRDNNGCADTLFKPAYIQAHKATAAFNATQTSVCPYQPVNFVNTSTGSQLTYVWEFGDGDTSHLLAPVHGYAQPGIYTVTLTVLDSIGCTGTHTQNITVHDRPDAAFGMDDSVALCPPLQVHFTNTSTNGATSYTWIFGDGNGSVLQNPDNIFINSGNFTVQLIAVNSFGCPDTATAHVNVLGYAGGFTYAPLTGCSPLTVQFTASATNVPAYVFDFSDGVTLATTSPTVTHTYTEPGLYVPKLIMTNNAGCAASSVGLDTIKVDDALPGFTFTTPCENVAVQFIDTSHGLFSGPGTRLWLFGNGVQSTLVNPVHIFGLAGTYPVTLIATTATGCVDTLDTTVVIYPPPPILAKPDTVVCHGDTITLHATGGVSYAWAPGTWLSCTACADPIVIPMDSIDYVVTGIDVHGCINSDTLHIKMKAKITATASADVAICEGESIMLTAGGGHLYNWTPPNGLTYPSGDTVFASPVVTTQYAVVVKEGNCEADTAYVTVTVHPKATVDAGVDQTILAGNTAQLQAIASPSVTHYSWSPPDSLSCVLCPDPEATPHGTTTYKVVATTDYGCKDSDVVTIFLQCAGSELYIPNLFTPDNNGVNDKFYVRGKGIDIVKSFKIYDRWGQVVFERENFQANDISQGWDGTYKGKVLTPDTFVYTVEATCFTGEAVKWQGDITLIR